MKTENGCYNCKDGFYRDILGSPCRYNFCPICGRKLDKAEELIDPAEINTRHEALQLVNQERTARTRNGESRTTRLNIGRGSSARNSGNTARP